ncbi:alpha-tocopherol transfer protein-like isoform X1 [Stomoxys calcitrans]|uniref:alpha-tocopherol transfer protein-like isoform X1 n=1 Tax=Stomoxys calcitrans TaxID=35570 RepID=UPI0027E2F3E1|nr:alpha-tocopherol transfer protein-like isoform X1 [Stomoxys calcitrans]
MLQVIPLSAELQKIANEELGEVPHRISEDLMVLKDWIALQPYLRARTDDQFLIQFLRGCKYSLEKAKNKIDKFYALKSKCPELFSVTNVDECSIRRFHNLGSVISLPIPLNDCGPRIYICRCTFDPRDFYVGDGLRYVTALNEIAMMSDPYTCICGTLYIMDFANSTTAHLMVLTPNIVRNLIQFFEKTIPVRIKAICIINLTPYAHKFCNMMLQYAPEKLKNRIHLCGTDLTELEEYLPRKYLPVEYGGENGSLEQLCKDYNKVWDEYREYFKENAQYGTDERLRVGKKIELDGDLGINGSFRKLDVD